MEVDEEDDIEEEQQFGGFGFPRKTAAKRPVTRSMIFGFGNGGFDMNQP